MLLNVLLTKETERGSMRKSQSKILPRCQNPPTGVFVSEGILLGSAFPKPCCTAPSGAERRRAPLKKTYNTPHRTRVVKTRMTEDEYADFSKQLSLYGIS